MGARVTRQDYTWSYTDEPHATRRKLILEKYPQVKNLMRVDAKFKWQVTGLVLLQFLSFYLLRNVTNFWVLLILAYLFGGVGNHALMLAIHETAHGMAFGTCHPIPNKLFGMFANLPLGFPLSVSFKKYHLEHHRYQGDDVLDTDIPTSLEVFFFANTAMKFLWCFLQPIFYTMRPLMVNPKPFDNFEIINVFVQILFNTFIVSTLGYHILLYMLVGSILVMGLHPVAGHFISEHTIMFDTASHSSNESTKKDAAWEKAPTGRPSLDDTKSILSADHNVVMYPENRSLKLFANGHSTADENVANKIEDSICHRIKNSESGDMHKVHTDIIRTTVDSNGKFLVPETCSYYGPLNWVTFNVGYHVEHHDFPSIPGSRLPELRKIAPEFYSTLNYHTSWTKVMWQYITDPNVGPFARVRRPHSQKRLNCLE